MNTSLISSLSLAMTVAVLMPGAYADIVWAPGVSLTEGWFDTNKAYTPMVFWKDNGSGSWVADNEGTASVFANNDSAVCWAASATNILLNLRYQLGYEAERTDYADKWQSTLTKPLSTYSANNVSTRQQYTLFQTFLTNFRNTAYDQFNGIAWYTTGSKRAAESNAHPLKVTDSGGYYADVLGGSDIATYQSKVEATHYYLINGNYAGTHINSGADGISIGEKATTYTELFTEALKTSAMALNVADASSATGYPSGTHSLTCWGFETDENGEINLLYITDSDDGIEHLLELPVIVEDGLLKITGTDQSSADALTRQGFFCTIDGDTVTKRRMANDYTGKYVYDFGSFQNFYALIPEPSTATLSLMAITGLLLRRRRKI